MAQRTDEELIKIVTTQRNDYQPEAILIAEQEIRNRKIWSDDLSLKIDEKVNECKVWRALNAKDKWKIARNGVFLFCFFHLIYEVMTGNTKSAGLAVIITYFISAWYIKDRISQGKESENLFLMGLYVSAVAFIIRLILGTALVYLMTK